MGVSRKNLPVLFKNYKGCQIQLANDYFKIVTTIHSQ